MMVNKATISITSFILKIMKFVEGIFFIDKKNIIYVCLSA